MTELRWLEKDGVKTLQYRRTLGIKTVIDEDGAVPRKDYFWTQWTDVPTVREE